MVRAVLAIVFATFLFAVVHGWYKATGTTPDGTMWDIGIVGILALLYSSFNSFNALRFSTEQTGRVVYLGLLFSFLPLLVAVYSIAVYQYSPSKLNTFQIISMVFGGLAAIIDLTLFSWLTFGHVRSLAADRHRG